MRKLSVLTLIFGVIIFVLAACSGNEASSQPANTSAPAPEENQAQPVDPAPAPEELAEAVNTETQENAASGETEQQVEAPESEQITSEEGASGQRTEEGDPTEAVTVESSAAEPDTAETGGTRTFILVPEQSRASYIVDEEFFGGAIDRLGIQPGLVDTVGSTQQVSGEMQLDFGNPADPLISNQFQVNLQSLTSDQSRRDNRIREANLESNRFPLALFTITSLENAPASLADGDEVTFQARGDITIREITQPATFDVTAQLNGDIITGVATTQLKMTDFGFEPPNFVNLFSVANDFTAQVEFTFQEQ